MKLTTCFVCLLLTCSVFGKAKETYLAAVVEYHSVENDGLSFVQRLEANADKYEEVLRKINRPLDIIVFPESSLRYGAIVRSRQDLIDTGTLVPDPKDRIAPCSVADKNVYENFFVKLSCTAKKYKTYMVINTKEKTNCKSSKDDHCKQEDRNVYNTNVVFDREGKVIARYRKYNLFGEYGTNTTKTPEQITFKTDFGVSFGTFICFDLLFGSPAVDLVRNGVKHFVYPTMWFSELPFLTALQVQQQWAEEHNVVLLASNANNYEVATSGSGIYQGNLGGVEMYVDGVKNIRAIVQEVQKDWSGTGATSPVKNKNAMADFGFWKDDLSLYGSKDFNGADEDEQVCSRDSKFCCNFHIKATKLPTTGAFYRYKIAAYSGLRSFSGVSNNGIEVCALVACLNQDIASCSMSSKGKTTAFPFEFNSITVTGRFIKEKANQYPNSLDSTFIPIDKSRRQWETGVADKAKIKRTHKLTAPTKDVLTFGIYARYYKDDVITHHPDSDANKYV